MRLPRPRVTIRRMMVATAVAAIVAAAAKSLLVDNRPRDILAAAISAPDGEYTVYAGGYSESKFRSLRAGMTVRQVEEIMGPPLDRGRWMDSDAAGPTTAGEGIPQDIWYYTRAGKARGDYWRREVWFRDGLVYHTEGTYYMD